MVVKVLSQPSDPFSLPAAQDTTRELSRRFSTLRICSGSSWVDSVRLCLYDRRDSFSRVSSKLVVVALLLRLDPLKYHKSAVRALRKRSRGDTTPPQRTPRVAVTLKSGVNGKELPVVPASAHERAVQQPLAA